MPTTTDYLNELIKQKTQLAINLNAKGVTATEYEKFNTLVAKVNDINTFVGDMLVFTNIAKLLNFKNFVKLTFPDTTQRTINCKLQSKNLVNIPDATATQTNSSYAQTQYSISSQTLSDIDFIIGKTIYYYGISNNEHFTPECALEYTEIGSTTLKYITLSVNVPTAIPTTVSHISNLYIRNRSDSAEYNNIETTVSQNMLSYDPITEYSAYVSDFTNKSVTRSGKNFVDISTIPTTETIINNGDSLTVTGNPYLPNVTLSQICPNLKIGDTVTLSLKITNSLGTYTELSNIYLSAASYNWRYGNTITITQKHLNSKLQFFCRPSGTPNPDPLVGTISEFQIELGDKVTDYVSYQQSSTYTANAEGVVTGIQSLYPDTILRSEDSVIISEISGNIYKEILPSEGKDGFTKVYQPIVDSTIDSNITSDNIKQGVSILGVTGDYICNYTYDETTKELVLIL